MIYTIESPSLKVSVKQTGAELCSITSKKTGKEYIWQGNPNIWDNHAPVLFPIVGTLKEDKYFHQANWHEMPRHGIIRKNKSIEVEDQTESSITLVLNSDVDSKKSYPFDFKFRITFSLLKNILTVSHQVINTGNQNLLFSLGAHPAFNCPIHEESSYEDYYLEFEQQEHAVTHLLNMEKGLINNETEIVLNNTNRIPLHNHLFDRDALIFKNLKSNSLSLVHKENGDVLTMNFPDFPYLGIWAKPAADFVCIEPWLGIADNIDHNQKLEDKEGIISLAPDLDFEASYSIQIYD